MNEIIIKEKYILEYIRNMLYACSYAIKNIDDNAYQYHHNTAYEYAPSIIKYGILSIEELNSLGIRSYSKDYLKFIDDIESHVNGKDGISLSVTGLTDLYKDEDEYDPCQSNIVDFLVDENIKTVRNTTHYGNEFISENKISNDRIISADIRIINYINNLSEKDGKAIFSVINKYNQIIMMSKEILRHNRDMQMREMSEGVNRKIDVEKMSEMPRLLMIK
jgi:hypothetical protein